MAEADRPSVSIEPERKVASVFGEDHAAIRPPVNVLSLAQQHADVEHVDIPANLDGLLRRSPGRRPLILISKHLRAESPRYRFTLAHELGHLIIPWQLGNALCHIDGDGRLRVANDVVEEAEANKFASELLVPAPWLERGYLDRTGALAPHIVQTARTARVSVSVVMFAIRRIARPGTLIVTHDGQMVQTADTSLGTPSDPPKAGSSMATLRRRWSGAGCVVSDVSISQDTWITSVEFPTTAELPDIEGSVTSTVLLKTLFDELEPDLTPEVRRTRFGQINGGVSTVNISAHYKLSEEQMFAGLVQKFSERGHLGPVVRDPRFREFLALKARELTSPKPAPKRPKRRERD